MAFAAVRAEGREWGAFQALQPSRGGKGWAIGPVDTLWSPASARHRGADEILEAILGNETRVSTEGQQAGGQRVRVEHYYIRQVNSRLDSGQPEANRP